MNDDDNDCDANADCTNTVGSFECACKDGFSGDGVQCDDINECDLEIDNCHDLATCQNKKVKSDLKKIKLQAKALVTTIEILIFHPYFFNKVII